MVRKRFVWLGLPLLLFGLLAARPAAGQFGSTHVVDISAQWDVAQARPGDQRVLAVVLDIRKGYHVNAEASRIPPEEDFLVPTSVTLSPVGAGTSPLTLGRARFPEPHYLDLGFSISGQKLPVYEGRSVVYVPVMVAADAQPGEAAMKLSIEIQACDDTSCLMPETVERDLTLSLVPAGTAIDSSPRDPELFAGFDPAAFSEMAEDTAVEQTPSPVSEPALTTGLDFRLFGYGVTLDPSSGLGFIGLLAAAALGGLLLNFTPCVLPVIPIKVMSLAQAAHDSRAREVLLGVVMFLGVLAFWVGIGVAIAFVAGFNAISELFKFPWFTIGVGVVIAAMAIGMWGLFTVRLPRWIYAINPRQNTVHGSFGFGVMTAILSTPCTAPFMGTAAGWATQQHSVVTLATFLAIGGGMGLPYFLLAVFPNLVDRLPRTGPGSELLKQVMAIFMLAAASYFIGTGINALGANGQGPTSQAFWWAVFAAVAAGGAWLAVRSLRVLKSKANRAVFTMIGIVVAVAAVAIGAPLGVTERVSDENGEDTRRIKWVYYTPEAFEQQLAAGKVVVMDFTADWCINCKVLERNVLESDAVASLLDEPGVAPMKVDITSRANVEGAAMLRKMERLTIPLLVVFDPLGRPVFKADFYTADEVVAAVREARMEATADSTPPGT